MKRRLLLPMTIAAALPAAAAQPRFGAGSQNALEIAGPQAAHFSDLWWLTVGLCTVVFCAVLAACVIAVMRAPRAGASTPPDVDAQQRPERGLKRSVSVAVALSVLGLFVLVTASVWTDRALAHLGLQDALHVQVTGHQWWWEARYDDPDPTKSFVTANELHIPVGRPVILTLRSDDVIHSLWVPNLAGKKDLIPGRTATLNLRADRAGDYRGQCAEFCGAQHAWMAFRVIAEAPADYDAWAGRQRAPAQTPGDALALRGQQVFLGAPCVMCHAVSGTEAGARRAPDLTHVGSRLTIAAGALPNRAAELASWITNPQAHKPGTNMPGQAFAPADMQALVAYLQGLK